MAASLPSPSLLVAPHGHVRWGAAAWVRVSLVLSLVAASCDTDPGSSAPPPREGRGATLSVTELYTLSLQETNDRLKALGVPVTARYGVRSFKLIYETVDAQGEPVQASGAVVAPSPVLGTMDILSFQHGTILRRGGAPSQSEGAQFIGIGYAADGYLSVLPDLLGLGESQGLHPYHHAATAGTAVVDMLRATSDLAAAKGWMLSGQLFLTGYSQGGYTAMAVHRALEEDYADEFTVMASAPMAGAYDLSGVMTETILSTEPYPSPYYLPYLILAYNEVYGLYDDPSEFLVSPYDTLLPPLFDGTHGEGEVNALLPDVPREILNPALLAAFEQDPNHMFRLVLAENDVHRWAPKAPIRMYHCAGDRHVPIANAHAALEGLKGGSASVELIEPVQDADHFGCAAYAIYSGKAWIDTF